MTKLSTHARASDSQRRLATALLAGTAMAMAASPAFAQESEAPEEVNSGDDVIVVTGIRSSLESALNEKRQANSLIEVIQAEDIGKLPDQNLAEVLENVTGVQITRTAGVGTGVQIRGTNDNRTEINGVSTVGSGTGRGGINFEDVNAAIISAVEVTKAPTAQTIEGSVGGTINLRTIRPLDLDDPLIAARIQGEYSELSDSVSPRISASFGNKWETGIGEFGVVIAGSYAEQEATSFRPRVDRDTVLLPGGVVAADGSPGPTFPFLGIQFLNQELENFEFETINLAGSLEWKPTDGLKIYFDGIYNDQERRQDSSRVQGSGVSSLRRVNVPDSFETVNFGSLDGVELGSIQAALTGAIEPNIGTDDDDPNLRFSSDVGARLTTSEIYRLGAEFETGRLSVRVEGSLSSSRSRSPDLSTTLNFINPGVPFDNLDMAGNPTLITQAEDDDDNPVFEADGITPVLTVTSNGVDNLTSNDNPVPFIFDLTGGSLAFGINPNSAFTVTADQLLDPNNVVLDAVTVGDNRTRNSEDAARIDLSYDFDGLHPNITSVDAGYRYNKTKNEFTQVRSTFGTGFLSVSPSGATFADLLVPGPDNFGDADGRDLFFGDFLVVDPDAAFSDRDGTLATLQAALDNSFGGQFEISQGRRLLNDPSIDLGASFRVEETTHAAYGQVNLEFGRVRANIGARYVDTTIDSFGNGLVPGGVVPVTSTAGYSEWLPRINVIADVTDNVVVRASYSEDINRPDFNDLSLSTNFPTGPNNAVNAGNPGLQPETVASFDFSADWYFAPSSVISVGFFHKVRTNLFVNDVQVAPVDANGFRDIDPACTGGGIFNPIPDRNVLSDQPGNGLCVPINTVLNDTGNTKQTGVEVAFQYDLSQFEDTLGFASGFGILANYTYQKFSGGDFTNISSTDSRADAIFNAAIPGNAPITAVQGLLDFSQNAYNITGYYEKYGISARVRYTWRDAFRTLDTAGGASLRSTLGFPTVTESRGQLNASITYDITDNINIGVEGVNLTKSEITQSCVNEGALLCFQGLPDRRLTFGASVRF